MSAYVENLSMMIATADDISAAHQQIKSSLVSLSFLAKSKQLKEIGTPTHIADDAAAAAPGGGGAAVVLETDDEGGGHCETSKT